MLEIAKKYPEMMFHSVGNQAGNFADYWQPLMKDVPSNVKIWGERADVELFMTAADVFMFNSTRRSNIDNILNSIENELFKHVSCKGSVVYDCLTKGAPSKLRFSLQMAMKLHHLAPPKNYAAF